MSYDTKNWKRRIAERTDLSTQVIHLTRAPNGTDLSSLMLKILIEKRIVASAPAAAFIHGDRAAVCFQDAPLSGICQNVFFEQKYREQKPDAKLRYQAAGFAFDKAYVYARGGRPVVYDRAAEAKSYLPKAEWWRIVNFDLIDPENIVDWTHEREWRIPTDFMFEWESATILLVNEATYRSFMEKCKNQYPELPLKLKGIVVLSNILY